ncbi:MAG: ATP-dependent DNA helicase RecG [Syntrophales bacterium]
MELIEKLLKQIEAPLTFVSADNYDRLSLVKNLDHVVPGLSQQILDGISLDREIPEEPRCQIGRLSVSLAKLFEGYDGLSLKQKQMHVTQAMQHVAQLKAIVKNLSTMPASDEHVSKPKYEVDAVELLSRSVRSIHGVGPHIAELLGRMSLFTIEDMLYFLPRRYEDRRGICRIPEAVPGVKQAFLGRIVRADIRFYGRKRIFEVTVDDGDGTLTAKWFKGREAFLRGTFKIGRRVILTGRVTGFPFEKDIIHPDFEIIDENEDASLHFKRIIPIYSETAGIRQKTLRRIMWRVVRDYAQFLQSPIPEEVSRKRRLMEIAIAARQVHFPDADQAIDDYLEMRSDAHRRLIYDEFFFFQLGMALRKHGRSNTKGISFAPGGVLLGNFYKSLPFVLTAAQQRVIADIEQDMASSKSMNRLLQGDVGSGKTVVSMAAMIIACENGFQSALMTPTEILAEQHYRNLKGWSDAIGIKTEFLTGGMNVLKKKELQARIMDGQIDILIGTHALIQEGITFRNLGLVVIDEQHRFGVIQRAALRKKGISPDVLVMTATPIPRTLAMTVYGDLDLSVIDEMPPGKKTIRTKVFNEAQRNRVYEIMRREVQKGNQVFIVYPLVEESENLALKDATRMAEQLQRKIFPECHVGLVHGRMKGTEKNQVMTDFIAKKIQILVSTTIIEVGIDIPTASMMVIEHAERFGLSQLHQLRGRVGRSDIPSYCILLAQRSGTGDSYKRLRIMEETNDGFRIAEEDLAIRGPGEFLGTKQSGLPDFRIADIIRDYGILADAKADAFALVEEDHCLEQPTHIPIREVLDRRLASRLDLAKTG